MENILISFTADTGALDEINQKLATTKQNMAGIVTGSGGSATGKGATPGGSPTTSAEKKAVDDLTKSNQLLIKSNDDLLKKYNQLAQQFQSLQGTVRTSATGGTQSLNALAAAQQNVNAQIGNTTATQSYRTQLRLLREEMARLDAAGQRGSSTYNRLSQQAGAIGQNIAHTRNTINAMGSDTQAFDSILAGTQLVAGGFSVMEGAAALAGGADADMQKQMVKLQAVIAITTGLQQVATTVTKEGALMTGIATVQSWASSKAEAYRRLVQIQGTSATVGATIAQKALNVVASANPYILLAMAITTVVGAIFAWNKGVEELETRQERLNAQEENWISSLERYSKVYKDAGAERERVISNDIELLKAQNAAQDVIAKKESQLVTEKLANATFQAGIHKKEIDDLDANKNKLDEVTASMERMKQESIDAKAARTGWSDQSIGNKISYVFSSDDLKEKMIEAQTTIDRLTPIVKMGFDYKTGYDKAKQDKAVDDAKQKTTDIKNAHDDAIAIAEIHMIEARKGSAQELVAHIANSGAQLRLDLDNATLTATQRRLITAKANKDIADARRAFALSELEDEKAMIESKVSLSKKGSDEEFNNQKDLLKKQLDIELSDINQSIPKKLALIDKYQSEVDQMDKDHNAKRSTESLNADISLIEAKLSAAKAGSTEEYQLKADLIEKKRALDVKGAGDSITDAKERAAKIKEINAAAQKDLADLTYTTQTASLAKNSEAQVVSLSEDYKNGLMSKAEYEAKKELIAVNSLKRQIDIEETAGKDGLAQKQELLDKEIKMIEDANSLKKELLSESLSNITGLFNAIQDGQSQEIAQQMDYLKDHYTTDVEEAKKNKELKLISQADYDKRQNALALKQKNAEKASKRFGILAGAAESIGKIIFKALETQAAAVLNPFLLPLIPFIWGQIPLVGAQAAIQLGNINKYAKGRKGNQSLQGEMAWVGEQGPEIMYVPNGASILPAHKSNKVRDAIGIMREYNIPVMPYISNKAMEEAKISNAGINYDLLARKIGEQMKQNLIIPKSIQRPVSINVDQSGTRVTDGDTTTLYRNRKYIGNV